MGAGVFILYGCELQPEAKGIYNKHRVVEDAEPYKNCFLQFDTNVILWYLYIILTIIKAEVFEMKSTGIMRQIDSAGRIVLPKELRTMLGLKENSDYLEIFTQGEFIMLKKYSPCCIFCDSTEDVIDYFGKKVCRTCAAELFEKSRNI